MTLDRFTFDMVRGGESCEFVKADEHEAEIARLKDEASRLRAMLLHLRIHGLALSINPATVQEIDAMLNAHKLRAAGGA